MHELDPSYLGYLRCDEVSVLLEDLLAAEWSGTWLETAWLRAMLRRHLTRLGEVPSPEPHHSSRHGRTAGDPGTAPPDGRQDQMTRRLREALPRVYDEALRRDLTDLLGIMERDMLRRGGTGLPIRDKAGAQRAEPRQGAASTTAREPADAQP